MGEMAGAGLLGVTLKVGDGELVAEGESDDEAVVSAGAAEGV